MKIWFFILLSPLIFLLAVGMHRIKDWDTVTKSKIAQAITWGILVLLAFWAFYFIN